TASMPLKVRVSSKAAAQVSSGQFRVLTWLGTIDAVRQKPLLGFGAGTFEFAYPRFAKAGFTRMAHNSYLQFAAELGLLGLALWIWMLAAALLGARSPDPSAVPPLLKRAAAAGIIGSAMHNAVDYGWYLTPTACAFWLCVGLSCGSAFGTVRSRCAAVGMALLAAVASLLLPLGIGEIYAEQADAQNAPAVKAELYRTALRWDPLNPDYRSDYATSLAWAGSLHQEVLPNEQGAIERQNFLQALFEFARAVSAEPNRAKLRYRYGLALERAGRLDDALIQYLAAVRLEPNATTPLMAAARLYLQKGELKAAEELYRRITSLEQSPVAKVKALEDFGDPNYAEAHLALAEAALARGDVENARREALLGVRAADEALLGLRRWKDVQKAAGRYDESQEARLELVKKRLLDIAKKMR
ncbi:MAG: O-antigen ligase family protein, partial [Armatimonadota bacterium]